MKRRYYKSEQLKRLEALCFKVTIIGILWMAGLTVAFQKQLKLVIQSSIKSVQNQRIERFGGQGPFSDALKNKHNLFVYNTIYNDKK